MRCPSGIRSSDCDNPSNTAVVGQVSRHWPVLLATASARESVVNPNARIEAPGRPSGLSSEDMNRSTPTSASQPMTLVA